MYRAEHVDTGEIAAVKVLAPIAREPGDGARFEVDGDGSSVPDGVGGFGDGLADDAAEAATHSHSPTRELLTRELEREAEILRGLHHANVIRFVDAERDADGSMCVVTEFVDAAHGGSIAASLRRSGPFGENLIRSYSRQILAALAYIHARGIVHRDVKGANVLIAANGVVKLADFGSATALERRGGRELRVRRVRDARLLARVPPAPKRPGDAALDGAGGDQGERPRAERGHLERRVRRDRDGHGEAAVE